MGLGIPGLEETSLPTRAEMKAATRYVTRQAQPSSKKGKGSSSSDFEKKHPRARAGVATGGQFISKGATSDLAGGVAAKLGVKGQGKFTAKDVRAYQRKKGLLVDGKIGRQTASSLLGHKDRAPGALPDRLRRKLTGKGH